MVTITRGASLEALRTGACVLVDGWLTALGTLLAGLRGALVHVHVALAAAQHGTSLSVVWVVFVSARAIHETCHACAAEHIDTLRTLCAVFAWLRGTLVCVGFAVGARVSLFACACVLAVRQARTAATVRARAAEAALEANVALSTLFHLAQCIFAERGEARVVLGARAPPVDIPACTRAPERVSAYTLGGARGAVLARL